jgi:hypothetical protein
MGQEAADYIEDLNPLWPLTAEKQYTWPGHFQSIKRSLKQSFPAIQGAMTASHTELNLLDGKTELFNATLGTPVRKTYFEVPLTSGLAVSFSVPEAEVGDLVRGLPDNSNSEWETLTVKAAWVTEKGRVALFFYKVGTTDPSVIDTGFIQILLVK